MTIQKKELMTQTVGYWKSTKENISKNVKEYLKIRIV